MSSFWISTATGGAFDIGDPQPDMVHWKDLSASLVQIPRFTGHTRPLCYYPVSQHSVACAIQAQVQWEPWPIIREAFGHDLHEAYTGDWNTILKNLIEDRLGASIRDLVEGPIARAVRERFGLPAECGPEVKLIDARMLVTEKRDLLMPGEHPGFWWPDFKPYPELVLAPVPNHETALRTLNWAAKVLHFV